MGGGLMQLVAYGAQDIYLTGNPQITFFKVVYRRHTNFSMEAIKQTINGQGKCGATAQQGNVTISRNGDLVHRVYVTSASAGITNGSAIVDEVELEIGGQRIDRHYRDWNEAWNELSTPESKAIGLKAMQGCIGSSTVTAGSFVSSVNLVQVPLNFWFCRNPGLALPLIALQYHEVKLKFTWGLSGAAAVGTAADCEVWCDYIYLDTDERRRFAQVSHEYLIEQIQKEDKSVSGAGAFGEKLNFNHPVKELIWTYGATDYLDDVQLKLNGHDRFAAQNQPHFTLRQPYDYHTAVPRQNLPTVARLTNVDRSTGLAGITGGTTGGVTTQAMTAQDTVASSGGEFNIALNVLTMGATTTVAQLAYIGGPATGSAGEGIPIGTTLAFVCTEADGGDATAQLTQGEVGNVYFATTTSLPTVATNVITVSITTPTCATDGTTLVATSVGAADPALFNVFVSTVTGSGQARTSQMTKKIGVYSFALKPEEHQPSGTCNFSRIDNAKFHATCGSATDFTVYAVNYNVLRIMSGMGGLAYSN
jgi:hypothetical protein